MGPVRALPMNQLMPRPVPVSPLSPPAPAVDVLKRMSGRASCRVHPIRHHVTGPRSAHPDKAGRRRAPLTRATATHHDHPRETIMTPP